MSRPEGLLTVEESWALATRRLFDPDSLDYDVGEAVESVIVGQEDLGAGVNRSGKVKGVGTLNPKLARISVA